MSKYNKREEELIKKLVDYDDNFRNLSTIGRFLSEKVFPEDLHIITRPDTNPPCNLVYCKIDKQREMVYFVAEVSLLLHDLVKNGFIKSINGGDDRISYVSRIKGFDMKMNGQKIDIYNDQGKTNEYINLDDNCWYGSDNTIKYAVLKFEEKQLPFQDVLDLCPIVSPELKKLVADRFKTSEDKTLAWTRVAAGVSLCAMLAAIFVPQNTSTRIDDNQYEGVIKAIGEEKVVPIIMPDSVGVEKLDAQVEKEQ